MQDDSLWPGLIGFAVVLATFIAVLLLIRSRQRRVPRPPDDGTGISGWLAVLAIGVTMLPLRLALSCLSGFGDYDDLANLPKGSTAFWVETVAIGALACLSLYVATVFWRKKASFRRLFVVLWALLLAYALLDPLVLGALLEIPFGVLFQEPEVIRNLAGSTVSVVWVFYVARSQRVAATFIR